MKHELHQEKEKCRNLNGRLNVRGKRDRKNQKLAQLATAMREGLQGADVQKQIKQLERKRDQFQKTVSSIDY